MRDIAQACAEGAGLALAGIAARPPQRWKIDGLTRSDRRPDADCFVPSHALSEAERALFEGLYIASDSSFHRVLRALAR